MRRSMVQRPMAKDTEKLIRQLSLISYLMAERRPVTALDIKRDVEGYSGMNEDAFARRFYADRAELESLRIPLTVEKPLDGVAEQENYSLRPENFHLPAIEFSDSELAALATALSLLDGEFAYAEPLRLALQQITWGRPSPLAAPEQRASRSASPPRPAATSSRRASRRSRPRSSATRRSRSTTSRWSAARPARASSTPTTCCSAAASSTCSATRTSARRCASSASRGSAARSPTRPRPSTTSAGPTDFDPRAYAKLAAWQFGEIVGTAEIRIAERIAWQIERHFGGYGEIRDDRRLRRPPVRHRLRQRAPADLVGARPRRARPGARARPSWRPSCSRASTLLIERHTAAAGRRRSTSRRGTPARRPTQRQRRSPGARRRGDPPRALRPAGHARLDPDRGRARRASGSRSPTSAQRLQISDARAARGHRRPQRRQLRRRHLRPLRRDPRGRRHDRGRPRALQRHLRPPGAPAAGRGEGAGRRDRPDRRAHAAGLADLGARRRSSRRSARTRWSRACRSPTPAPTTRIVSRVISQGDRRAACCSSSTTTRRTRTSTRRARSSPTR